MIVGGLPVRRLQSTGIGEEFRSSNCGGASGNGTGDGCNILDPRLAWLAPDRFRGAFHFECHLAGGCFVEAFQQPLAVDARHEPHVDAHARFVWHRVDVYSAAEPAYVKGGPSKHRMLIFGEIETGQSKRGTRSLVDGVLAFFRHRSVRGDPLGRGFQPKNALVAGKQPVPGRLRNNECPRGREQAPAPP